MNRGLRYLNKLVRWSGGGDFGLGPISQVLRELGNPQDSVPSIHVAGTNGKGSTSVAIASILGASGLKVGLTISPHLSRLTERIVIDGFEIDEALLGAALEQIESASRSVDQVLSYHEALTAAAFVIFRDERCDFSVVEVGLGGRLDASNVIHQPEICMVTSIGLDHVEVLGGSLESIAFEKAGIFKNGSRALMGEGIPESARTVIREVADRIGIALEEQGKEYGAYLEDGKGCYWDKEGGKFQFRPSLAGAHQIENMGLAIRAALKLGVSRDHCRVGVESCFWPGRLETIVNGNKEFLIDCAHNPHGVEALIRYLESRGVENRLLVFGCLDTKDWRGMIRLLSRVSTRWIVTEPDSPSAVPRAQILEELSSIGIRGEGVDRRILMNKINMLDYNALIILTGSIYLVGELREMLGQPVRPLWRRGEVER